MYSQNITQIKATVCLNVVRGGCGDGDVSGLVGERLQKTIKPEFLPVHCHGGLVGDPWSGVM